MRRPRPALRALAMLAVLAWAAAGLAGCARDRPATSPGSPAPSASPTKSDPPRWVPPARVSWQWQLSGPLDLGVDAQVYDVDLFETSAAQVAQLHAMGRKVICYLDAGTYEPFRPDHATYPKVLLGDPVDGWPDERWLDIRRLDLVMPLIAERMQTCKAKGFDGVEPDNLDGYANDTGFPLTAGDQARFNIEVAQLAHQQGLAVGLKNDVDQAAALQPLFDFALVEECAYYRECSALMPFARAGKPVLEVEYQLPPAAFCPQANQMGFSALRKSLNLDARRVAC
jgi:hypothetical protein